MKLLLFLLSFLSSLLLSTLFFVSANTWNGVKVGLQPPPYEHFCQHKLDFVDYQYVKRYAHNLLQFRTGVKFSEALQNCKHHAEHDEIRCGDDKRTRETVLELLKDPLVEQERQKLHVRSEKGFDCVHEFEKAVAKDHQDQHWHLPIEMARSETSENDYHDDEGHEIRMKKNIDYYHDLVKDGYHPGNMPHLFG
jgi:hypothetical protein